MKYYLKFTSPLVWEIYKSDQPIEEVIQENKPSLEGFNMFSDLKHELIRRINRYPSSGGPSATEYDRRKKTTSKMVYSIRKMKIDAVADYYTQIPSGEEQGSLVVD